MRENTLEKVKEVIPGSGMGVGTVCTHRYYLQDGLKDEDPELLELIKQEKRRQKGELELIAAENFTSRAVMEALGTCLINKNSVTLPGTRYFGGNQIIDQVESLCQKRALECFGLDPDKWGVNVQPYSGAIANFATLLALAGPGGRIMSLDLPDGGHPTYGYVTPEKTPVSATSMFLQTFPYKSDPATGLINYDDLEVGARAVQPQMLLAAFSCYPRNLDYKRFRQIADEHGAYVFADIAHISGLMASGVVPSCFDYCDVVTTNTQKSLRGPRSGMVFFRKGVRCVDPQTGEKIMYNLEEPISKTLFPAIQGGPHNHQIGSVAVALKQAMSPTFKNDCWQVVKNAQSMANRFMQNGFKVVTDGTDNHIVLVDFRNKKIDVAKVDLVLVNVGISANKNTCPGDKIMNPSGIRFGTHALTSRNLKEGDFEKVTDFIIEAANLAIEIQNSRKGTLLEGHPKRCWDIRDVVEEKAEAGYPGVAEDLPLFEEFKMKLVVDTGYQARLQDLRNRVVAFAQSFPMPGYDEK